MKKNKKRVLLILFILMASLLPGSVCLYAGSSTAIGNPVKSEPGSRNIPAIEFPMPTSEQEKNYLGLPGTGTFKIGQIKAEVLIIQVFSFY